MTKLKDRFAPNTMSLADVANWHDIQAASTKNAPFLGNRSEWLRAIAFHEGAADLLRAALSPSSGGGNTNGSNGFARPSGSAPGGEDGSAETAGGGE